jgi:uncharacterized membrane protein
MLSQTVSSDSILQRLARISLLIYPLIAHIGILAGDVVWPASFLIIVIYLNSLKLFSQQIIFRISFTVFMCALFYALLYFEAHKSLIYLPPILIPSWLAYVFLSSMSGEYALISKIAEGIECQPLDQQQLQYTRRLTALWGLVFIFMVCEAVFLAIWAPFDVWSWWVHIGNYIIVAILFLGELMLRHQFIGHRAQVAQMFRTLLQRNWRI